MAQAKFEINRDLYKELSLADARLKSTIDLFEKKEMSSQERLFFKIWASPKLKIGVFPINTDNWIDVGEWDKYKQQANKKNFYDK